MSGPGSHETHTSRPDRKTVSRVGAPAHARLVSAAAPRAQPVVLSPQLKTRTLPARAATIADTETDDTPVQVAPLRAPEQDRWHQARAALGFADRAVRLTFDAVIILVFSPVIGAWWLLERRRNRNLPR